MKVTEDILIKSRFYKSDQNKIPRTEVSKGIIRN